MTQDRVPAASHPESFTLDVDLDGVCANHTAGFYNADDEQGGNDPVIEYLQQIRAMREDYPGRRRSVEGLLLEVGRPWGDWVKDENVLGRYDLAARETKACFRNAGTAAMDNPELTYVEGYAGTLIPIMHAWCVTELGQIVDPTWEDGHHYFGIAFPTMWLRRHLVRTSVWGVFGGDYKAVNGILDNGLDSEVLTYNRRFSDTVA